MKKRVWSSVIAALLLVSLLAVGVFAEEETTTVTFAPYTDADGVRQYCACGNVFVADAEGTLAYVNGEDGCKNHKDESGAVVAGCDGTILSWKPMASGSIPLGNWGTPGTTGVGGTGSNYYLTGDVQNSTTNLGNATNGTYRFDLNGYTIYKNSARVLVPKQGGKLFFTDTSAGKTGKLESRYTASTSGQGAVVWFQNINATVTLFGGTIDGSSVTTTNTSGGATVYMASSGSVLNIFGGEIVGGTASAGNGGTISVNADVCTVNIYGGTVTGGTAVNGGAIYNAGTLNLTGGTVTGGSSARGGSIYSVGTVTMNGGKITGGTSSGNGGCVAVDDGTFTFNGGSIEGGTATNGGSVFVSGGTSAFTMTNAAISGGGVFVGGNASLNVNAGSVIYNGTITVNNGKVNIAGGQIKSYLYCINEAGVTNISGDPQIIGNIVYNAAGTLNISGSPEISGQVNINAGTLTVSESPVMEALNLAEGLVFVAGDLTEGADITVSTADGDRIIASSVADGTDVQYVHSSSDLTDVYYIEGEGLYLGKYGCKVCGGVYDGCDHAEKVKYTAWTGAKLPNESGNYYLVNGFEVSNQGSVDADATVVIDLNGQSVTRSSRIYRIANDNATLTVTDTGVGGSISSTWSASDHAAIFSMDGAATTLNLYAGTLDASGVTNNTYGAAVYVSGTFNMYGGTVKGGAVVRNSTNTHYGYGGAISVSSGGSFNMLGGEVIGGSAQYGGALGLKNGAAASVTGGKIVSGTGTNGTAVYVSKGAALTLKDAVVQGGTGGTTVWNCGVITMSGTVAMPSENFDLMIDNRNGGDCWLDIAELTSTGETPITLRRWELDNLNDDTGLLAVSATEKQAGLFAAWKADYYDIVYADGSLWLNMPHNFYGMNANGEYLGTFSDLADLTGASEEITWYQANKAVDGVTIGASIVLDLNGQELTNVTVPADVAVQLIDSATNDYQGEYGHLSGTVNGTVQNLVEANGKTYLVVNEDNAYSAHRYNVQLTHVSLDPNNDALGYKAQFNGDETVAKYVTGFGFNLWVDGGSVKTYSKEGGFTNGQVLTLRLKNILAANGGEITINGNAFVTFSVDNQTVTGNEHSTTMKQTLQAVNAAWASYSETQQAAVKALCDAYEVTRSWELTNIYPVETVPET